jgi:hypothetical protein
MLLTKKASWVVQISQYFALFQIYLIISPAMEKVKISMSQFRTIFVRQFDRILQKKTKIVVVKISGLRQI